MINLTKHYDVLNISNVIDYPKIHITYCKTCLLSDTLTWVSLYTLILWSKIVLINYLMANSFYGNLSFLV